MKFLKSYQGIMKVVGSSNKLIFRWKGQHVFNRSNFLNQYFPNLKLLWKNHIFYVLSHFLLEVDVIQVNVCNFPKGFLSIYYYY